MSSNTKSALRPAAKPRRKKRAKKGRMTLWRDIARNPFSYLLLLPGIAYTLIYGYFTLPWAVMAFQNFSPVKGIFGSEFVGLKNFEFFFKSTNCLTVTVNTIVLNLMYISTGVIFSVLMAMFIFEVSERMRRTTRVVQSCFLLPNFLSWIVISYIVYIMLSTEMGFVNQLLQFFGMEKVRWYSDPGPWRHILTFVNLWKNAGVDIIIYLAVLTGIDAELYEAATIDGANRFTMAIRITLPLLTPTICILTLMAIGRIFFGNFNMIYAIVKDNGVLFETTDIIDTYVFRAFRVGGDISQSTAIGLYQSLVGFLTVLGANKIVKKIYPEGALF